MSHFDAPKADFVVHEHSQVISIIPSPVHTKHPLNGPNYIQVCGNSLLNHGFYKGVFSMNGGCRGWDYTSHPGSAADWDPTRFCFAPLAACYRKILSARLKPPLGEENGHGMAGCSSPTCGKGFDPPHMLNIEHIWKYHQGMWTRHLQSIFKVWLKLRHVAAAIPIGSMYAKYGNIYHQYTPNISIYTIHGSYGIDLHVLVVPWRFNTLRHLNMGVANTEWIWR